MHTASVNRESIFKILHILRLKDWIYMLGLSLLAAVEYKDKISIHNSFVLILYSSIYLAYGYVFNNLFDQNEDECLNKNPFKEMQLKSAQLITLFLLGSFLLFSVRFGLFFEALFICFINAFYSMNPFRLKEQWVFALFANGLFFSFLFYSSAVILNGVNLVSASDLAMYVFMLFLPVQFIHCLEHKEVRGEKKEKKDFFICVLLFVFLAAYSFFLGNKFLFVATFFYSSVGIYLLAMNSESKKLRKRIRLLSLVHGLLLILALW